MPVVEWLRVGYGLLDKICGTYMAASFRPWRDAAGQAECQCLKGGLSAMHLRNSVSCFEKHKSLLYKFDWNSASIEGSFGTS